jgi:hypothetical protein
MPRYEESKILTGRMRVDYYERGNPVRRYHAPRVMVRKFNGELFESRDKVDLHRYKKDAEKAAENQRKKGFNVRLTKDRMYHRSGNDYWNKRIDAWRLWRGRKKRKG